VKWPNLPGVSSFKNHTLYYVAADQRIDCDRESTWIRPFVWKRDQQFDEPQIKSMAAAAGRFVWKRDEQRFPCSRTG